MVSGGTYGTEDIISGAGYGRGILILILTPLLWSIPVTLMVGELSSSLPLEGGYYAWVRRGMGNFWGFQEAWLSLVASIFDMAIYPTLFVAYLVRLFPWFAEGHRGIVTGLMVVAIATIANIAGIRVVGISSLWLFLLLSAPFALIAVLAPFKAGALSGVALAPSASNLESIGIVGGILVAMWNYMGWDSASTIAAEVDHPQKTYPRAMLLGLIIISASYIIPVCAMWITGISSSAFETGSWADLAGLVRRTVAARGTGAWWPDERFRNAQCAGDELFAPAARDGTGWIASVRVREATSDHKSAVGGDSGVRGGLGRLRWTRLRPVDHTGRASFGSQRGA